MKFGGCTCFPRTIPERRSRKVPQATGINMALKSRAAKFPKTQSNRETSAFLFYFEIQEKNRTTTMFILHMAIT